MWYQHIAVCFLFVTKHAFDRQNYDSQDRTGIAAWRSKNRFRPGSVLGPAGEAYLRLFPNLLVGCGGDTLSPFPTTLDLTPMLFLSTAQTIYTDVSQISEQNCTNA